MRGVGLVEPGDGDDAFLPDLEVHGLVGRVDGVLLQAEAHEDGFAAEDLLKGGNDRYRSSAACCQRTFAKGHLKTFLRGFVCRYVYRAACGNKVCGAPHARGLLTKHARKAKLKKGMP